MFFYPTIKAGIPRYALAFPCVSQWLLVSDAQPNLIMLNTTYVLCQLLHASECTELGDRIKIFSYNGKRENCSHLEAADCSFSKRLDAQFNWLCFTRKNIVHSLKHQNSNFQDICSFLNYNMSRIWDLMIFHRDYTFVTTIYNLQTICGGQGSSGYYWFTLLRSML